MSAETDLWLNTQTLMGHTTKRGNAWHYKAQLQGAESNHYPNEIPIADVRRRLFNFEIIKGIATNTYMTTNGITTVEDDARFPVGRADTGKTFGYFAEGYQIHQPGEWLLNNVEMLIDDYLNIGSAGNLKGGAQQWVSIEMPDNITTPQGVVFRPHLLAVTSHDGSLATTYKRVITNVVCDNTMRAGLAEVGQEVKIKHSSKSMDRIGEMRETLAIVHTIAADFQAELDKLCRTDVSDRQWSKYLELHVPLTNPKGEEKKGRSLTLATREREELTQLWNNDNRVSPWRNTAWGVVQAVNTYVHHVGNVRGMERADRNVERAVTGKASTLDAETMRELELVLSNA